MAHQEREARFLPPKHDRPRVDAASLPAAGVSARHNLSTQDEQRLKEGKVPLHYTFVDGAVHERPGGRRRAPHGVNETRVHECLGRADLDVGTKRSEGRREPERSAGRRAPPQGANATQVHECLGAPKDERSVDQHFTLVQGHIPIAKARGGSLTLTLTPTLTPTLTLTLTLILTLTLTPTLTLTLSRRATRPSPRVDLRRAPRARRGGATA